MAETTTHQAAKKSKRREKWLTFLGFACFSALEIWVLLTKGLTLESFRDWIILGGAIFFPICTIITWRSLRNDWDREQEDKKLIRAVGWLVAIPVALLGLGVAVWMATSTLGWLGSIPSWAAVIIVLLVLLLLKR